MQPRDDSAVDELGQKITVVITASQRSKISLHGLVPGAVLRMTAEEALAAIGSKPGSKGFKCTLFCWWQRTDALEGKQRFIWVVDCQPHVTVTLRATKVYCSLLKVS